MTTVPKNNNLPYLQGHRMTLKSFVSHGLLVIILAFTMPAIAYNFSFLKDAPYAHFTDEDRKIFEQLLYNILDTGADGETRTWSNENSKAGGKIKVLESFKQDNFTCRTLAIANEARGRSNAGKYNFCKLDTGEWKLAN
jgi:hypothetical protein